MKKARNISAVLFAFLLAGVVGVGTAQAVGVGVTNCGTDKDGNILYGYGGNCDGFNNPDDDAQPANNSSTVQSAPDNTSSQSYTQSQSAPQTDQQAVSESEKKKSVVEEKKPAAVNPATTKVEVAGATEAPQPLWPLLMLLAVSGLAGAYAFVIRRTDAFWHES